MACYCCCWHSEVDKLVDFGVADVEKLPYVSFVTQPPCSSQPIYQSVSQQLTRGLLAWYRSWMTSTRPKQQVEGDTPSASRWVLAPVVREVLCQRIRVRRLQLEQRAFGEEAMHARAREIGQRCAAGRGWRCSSASHLACPLLPTEAQPRSSCQSTFASRSDKALQ